MSEVYSDRDYQVRTYKQIAKAWHEGHRRIICCLPTGGGKGRMAARMIQMSAGKGRESIFFADQRELINQIANHLNGLGTPFRTIMSGVEDEYQDGEEFLAAQQSCLVAKDTLWARAMRTSKIQLPAADVVHLDECHRSLSRTYQAILEKYADSTVIGWTATPCRSDNKPLGTFYTKLIQAATYEELQRDGHLVPVRVIAPSRPDLKGCKVSRGDYAKGDLEKRMNRDEMVGSIIKEWRKHADGRSTVLFAAGISHSVHCRNEFRAIGVTAEHLDGTMETSEREDILGRVADGKVRVLCNYGVATTGVDVPAWKYMICARPTKSFSLHRQMGGRIQRPYPGHDHAMIQDHSDNCITFGHPDEDVDWDIDGEEDQGKKHAEKMKKPKDGDKEPREPYTCPSCSIQYRGPHCPACGAKRERKAEDVKMSKGELQELERKKANRVATLMDKQKHWDECLGWAVGTNKLVGAAAHRYKEKFGVFPNSEIQNVPRSSQWKMKGPEFYRQHVKPAADAAKKQAKRESELTGELF